MEQKTKDGTPTADELCEQCLRPVEHPFSYIEAIENRYRTENNLLDAVTAGNETAALECLTRLLQEMAAPESQATEVRAEWPGKLRNHKDMLISFNTLLRKAAESAGIHPAYIDSFSGGVVSAIEEFSSIHQCQHFLPEMVKGYCMLVRSRTENAHSFLVRRIVTYVDTDLKADLSLKALAANLGVNASYLSALFSREMGMGLTDYVNLHRINYAKKLLVNTNLPIKSIAEQCGYPDIHYFSRLFRRIVQLPPKAYREAYRNSSLGGGQAPEIQTDKNIRTNKNTSCPDPKALSFPSIPTM